MALDEPKLAEGDQQQALDDGTERPAKRDDTPDYYKRPKFKRNIIPFDTEDLSVRVIRERFLIPNQVTEGSAAQKAGLKLGDQILQINGADASAMRLATAQNVIKQAGEQLQMIVAKDDEENRAAEEQGKPKETREVKFVGNEEPPKPDVTNKPAPKPKDDERVSGDSRRSSFDSASSHDHRSLSCESCDSLSVLAVEQQLRQMQQQLNEISVIPMQIQATLSFLTKTLSKFAPPELQMQLPEALRASSHEQVEQTTDDDEDRASPAGALDDDEQQPVCAEDSDECAITLESLFDESQVLPTVSTAENGDDGELQEGEEEEPEPEISEEERSRIEKLERIIKLQKTWPWSQQEKPIHKRSNCHLVPSVALERSKIKQISDMGSLPFYKHGYLTRV